MSIILDQVVPWGRSREEYELMFALSEEDLTKTILGCADGPASFNAEMTADGNAVISVDPIYEFSSDQIRQRFEQTVDEIIDQVKATPDNWTWKHHRDVDDLRRNRERAIDVFLVDYEEGRRQNRYRIGALPNLPFKDREFELAVCSHFLFLYSNLFLADFHVKSAIELCRIAKQVRIFPLLTLSQTVLLWLDVEFS